MATAQELKRKIRTAQDLHSVVKTMKALAAVKMNEMHASVRALAEYNRTVKLALHALLRNRPPGAYVENRSRSRIPGIVVFGSDQGMCGQFNEEIVHHSVLEARSLSPDAEPALVCVGSRAASRLEDEGLVPEALLPTPASLQGTAPLVGRLLHIIQDWRTERGIDRVVLCHNMLLSSASYRARTMNLLPLDSEWLGLLKADEWPSRCVPIFTMDWDMLFAATVEQHLVVSLYRAATESQASENAARLASMQAADRNIEERLAELSAEYHHIRQTTITEEILDIVSGFEALTGEGQ
ncbi:MAG: F0F1 ATP synthase subunit gamma [Armatimonadetes bacterium]|nr:F0F1 ATP synthase subunit gamma [Armatimonadota bacterium]